MSEQRLDNIERKLTDIEIVLARNTCSLEEHMRRSALLEARQIIIESEQKEVRESSDERYRLILLELKESLNPIREHINFLNGATKAALLIGAFIFALYEMGIINKLFMK